MEVRQGRVAAGAVIVAAIGQAFLAAPEVPAEPPLKCYVLAACR